MNSIDHAEHSNQPILNKEYKLDEQNVLMMNNILKLFANGKEDEANRGFQKLMDKNITQKPQTTPETNRESLSSLSQTLLDECNKYSQELNNIWVTIDGDIYYFQQLSQWIQILSESAGKQMSFVYREQDDSFSFFSEKLNDGSQTFDLEISKKTSSITNKFEKPKWLDIQPNDFIKAFSEKMIDLMKKWAIEHAKEQLANNDEAVDKLKNML